MADPTPPQQPGAPRPPIDPTGTSTPPPPPPGYVPAVYVQHPTSGRGMGKVIMYLLAVALLVSVTVNVYLFGPVAVVLQALSETAPQEGSYNPVFEPSGDTSRVVVVELTGMIDGGNASYFRDAFFRLEKDPPGAVVMRVDSGGGYVGASDQMWHAVEKFKAAHPDVPIVVSFGSIAASGGYYISAPADYIFCERTTMTGSIGVMANMPAAGGLIEKHGLEMNVIVADGSPNKDHANNLFTQWYDKDGQLTQDGEDALLVVKNMLNRSYDTFLDVVVTGRTAANSKITADDMKAAATGKVYVGKEALDAKLVDEIGYLDDAIAYAAKQAKLGTDPIVTMIQKSEPGMLGSMLGSNGGVNLADVTGDELRELMDDATAIRLEYRMRIR